MRTFTIVKAPTTVKITSDSKKVYDGNAYEVTTIVTDKNGKIIENANVKYTYYKGLKKLESAPTQVGNYSVVASYTGSDKYIPSITRMNFKIEKAQLVVKINNYTKEIGKEDPKFEYSVDGLFKDDAVEFEIVREPGEELGEYKLTVKDINLTNYNYVVETGTLTIKKASIPMTPLEPSTPIKPEEPGKPSVPMTPLEPSKPIEPEEPGKPSIPMTPLEPSKPIEPEEPGKPSIPMTPLQPSIPTVPSKPGDSNQSTTPQTYDAGIAGSASVGILALGGLLVARRKRD